MSSFHLSIGDDELIHGLNRLGEDIETGSINKIIERYESNIGDYLYVTGRK